MNIFKVSSKKNFEKELIDFINNYKLDFSKLKILLPNGLICAHLQAALIKIHGTIILPKIMPISELADDEEIFQIPSNNTGAITLLEEKIALAEIINSYSDLNYNLSQSLKLSPTLSRLFYEFEANDLQFEDLKNLPKLDESEHWNIIYNFLHFSQEKWQEKLLKIGKISKAKYQKLIFESEINRLKKNHHELLIIAGIVCNNDITNNFIKKALALKNVFYIFPPFDDSCKEHKLSTEHPLYRINKLISNIGQQINISNLGSQNPSILDNLISEFSCKKYAKNIELIELENNLIEAEYISLKCKAYIENHPDEKIAIIVHSTMFRDQLILFLEKNNIKNNDLLGSDILGHPAISLLIILSKLLYSKFTLKNFFAFLSHPEISDDAVIEIKNIIRKKSRFVSDINQIKSTLEKYASKEAFERFLFIADNISLLNIENSFHYMFENALRIAEKFIPQIWKKYSNINSILSEIFNKKWKIKINENESFSDLLIQMLEGGRIVNSSSNNHVIICRPMDAALINYDLIIISEMNENTYPRSYSSSPWLNTQMQKELGLDSKLSDMGNSFYEFYLNLNNKRVILTRARKAEGVQTLESIFILRLKYIIGNLLLCKKGLVENHSKLHINEQLINSKSYSFPEIISATDIETLIRSPYNFYAKKILNLRAVDEISDHPNLADFGNFFHSVAEEYTNNFPQKTIEEISDKYLRKIIIPVYDKNAWRAKIMAIIPDFVEFEKTRRKDIKSVHCEIKGTLKLDIHGKSLTILAIADRIEINNDGSATILDYKTGAIPTKKDVLSGLSPQMIVEAIILAEGGFKLSTNKINKIIYVKINSQSPYIKTTEIKLSKENIQNHKQGLISLLEHYITHSEYPIEMCNMKYDDYFHLARRLS